MKVRKRLSNLKILIMKFVDLRKKLDINIKQNVKAAQARQKKQYDAKFLQGRGYSSSQKYEKAF